MQRTLALARLAVVASPLLACEPPLLVVLRNPTNVDVEIIVHLERDARPDPPSRIAPGGEIYLKNDIKEFRTLQYKIAGRTCVLDKVMLESVATKGETSVLRVVSLTPC